MKHFLTFWAAIAVLIFVFPSCSEESDDDSPLDDDAKLTFSFKFDPMQQRLNNFGQPVGIADGHAAQSPVFNSISAHYVELAPVMFTQLGQGQVLYQAPETEQGGVAAIDFSQSKVVDEGEVFLEVPLSDIAPGNYEYLRVSLAYQNYDIQLKALGFSLSGTLASFIGFNTYINSYAVKSETINVNDDKPQGYWAFEHPYGVLEGQLPPGAVTVPNVIADTSPISAGSCVVTGAFDQALSITGNETEDIHITVSLSTNNSFEWVDGNANGEFEPLEGETPTDMGIRGLVPLMD